MPGKKPSNFKNNLKFIFYKTKLERWGLVVETKDEQRLVNSVNQFYNKKKYLHKKTGEPLSKVDCFLLKFALTYGYDLVTTDTLLIHALMKENRYGKRVSVFNPDFYVLSQIDGRYSIEHLRNSKKKFTRQR